MNFVHLHTHTEYSLLDGAARIKDLVSRSLELGMTSLAITDHGVMYGVIDFYTECESAGIKPIIGMEAYVAPRSRTDREGRADKEYAHLILLAKDMAGYQNLMKLSSIGFTEGFYYKPRIDREALAEHKDGLICMSACLAGELPQLLLSGRMDDARELARFYRGLFGEDYYIEIQDHGLPEQKHILPLLITLSRETGIRLVATNDVHYVFEDDWEAQDALLCIQTNRQVNELNRMRMDSREFYLKSGEEMLKRFSSVPDAVSVTAEIAEKCNVKLDFTQRHLPAYESGDSMPHDERLRALCEQGLKARGLERHMERLDYELGVIGRMGFVDYFLIVWDFIRYAKERGIAVGPGRGSAAGSLVAYCLSITDIDPIKYNLLFERFLTPDRITMPDIDIDFCYERRQEVIDYVISKYGEDHVAQIITFGTMAARSVIRDVGRALGMPYGDVDRIAKLVPFELSITLERALSISSDLKAAVSENEDAKKLITLAKKLEGLPRHASTHAAGVVITGRPVTEYVPLQKNDEAVTTQFTMGALERLGLLKMDFLGLRTLTVIRDTEEMLSGPVDYGYMDDANVFAMISNGDTDGVFQLESAGMRSFMRDLKPDSFEDIIAGISLFRPGPMDQIPTFVRCKRNPSAVKYDHPLLEPILNNTYGCMVYQEQVMQIVRDLAGYTLSESDKVRRAMSKKKADVMAKEREHFLKGCAERGVDAGVANGIFDSMTDFAQYAFNKSHAAAYAVLAYRTAYLKLHYPGEFMAALINSYMGSADRIAEYIGVCRVKGIGILPPDVNKSGSRFSVEDGAIRFGLSGIRNVGSSVAEAIVSERQNGRYDTFLGFLERVGANKRAVEGLIKAGALDSLGHKRSQLMATVTQASDAAANTRKRKDSGQMSLFDDGDTSEILMPEISEYPSHHKLAFEKEATGLYISGHPLSSHEAALSALGRTTSDVNATGFYALKDGSRIRLGGIIEQFRTKATKAGNMMAFAVLEDLRGMCELVILPQILAKYGAHLRDDALVVITGRVDQREEGAQIVVDEIEPLGEKEKEPETLYLRVQHEKTPKAVLDVLARYPGSHPVRIVFPSGKVRQVPRELFVSASGDCVGELERLLLSDNVKMK